MNFCIFISVLLSKFHILSVRHPIKIKYKKYENLAINKKKYKYIKQSLLDWKPLCALNLLQFFLCVAHSIPKTEHSRVRSEEIWRATNAHKLFIWKTLQLEQLASRDLNMKILLCMLHKNLIFFHFSRIFPKFSETGSKSKKDKGLLEVSFMMMWGVLSAKSLTLDFSRFLVLFGLFCIFLYLCQKKLLLSLFNKKPSISHVYRYVHFLFLLRILEKSEVEVTFIF